jgi:UPF0176 protein
MQKILLYYKFMPVTDPNMTMLWQRALCEKLNLNGRIIISLHGINGTVGGNIENLKTYAKETKAYFKGTTFKWSDGGREDFPRLSIKVRSELVAFGAPDEIKVDASGVVNGGKHLKPEQVHELVEKYGEDVVFFDGRNAFEAKVGKFKNAVIPDTNTTHDFIKELDSNKYDDIKDKHVVTYCTGGIRCEALSALMKNRDFKNVYQIDGGIVKYGEKFKDDGYWEGKLYVFDRRLVTSFSEKAKDIGHCVHCDSRTSNFENCANMACNNLVLICDNCKTSTDTCSIKCQEIATKTFV